MYSIRTCVLACLVGSLFALIGCAPHQRTIATEALIHVESFEKRYHVYYPGDVVVADLMAPTVGQCYKRGNGETWIILDKKFVEHATFNSLEETIYHELGHCVLNLPHNNDMNGGCPVSIMYFQGFGNTSCYTNMKQNYFQQLEDMWKTSSGR